MNYAYSNDNKNDHSSIIEAQYKFEVLQRWNGRLVPCR